MNPKHPLGEILHDGGRTGLRYERELAHSPERVWRALTESDQLSHWLPCDIVGAREEGAHIRLPFWQAVVDKYSIEGPTLEGRILTWEPPRVFSWTWDTDTLTFELEPSERGTRLTFTTWIGATPGVAQTAAGYHVCFDLLAELLESGTAPPLVEQDPSVYEQIYGELVSKAEAEAG